jgi:hypothetical protein
MATYFVGTLSAESASHPMLVELARLPEKVEVTLQFHQAGAHWRCTGTFHSDPSGAFIGTARARSLNRADEIFSIELRFSESTQSSATLSVAIGTPSSASSTYSGTLESGFAYWGAAGEPENGW